ncbi:transmembrane protein 192 [Clupea harengus]|uniref:Transmembrane protein 192 n=1 Tax=Clupea harengus TaxID=7950 RepID=A0A6P3W157_CLUHA|nr:transmembrane protein 192 [Clupea harengus]
MHLKGAMDYKGGTHQVNNSSTDISQSVEDDPLIEGPLISQDTLESAIKREFLKLPTSWTAGLLLFLHVAFVCLSLVVCVLCGLLEGHRAECASLLQGVDSKKVVLLSKVALWMVSYIHQCYVEHHNTAARRRGYLLFYRQTRAIALLPLLIQSLGNVFLLLLLALTTVLDGVEKQLSVYLLLGILSLELLLSVTFLMAYIVKVVRFNTEKLSPDINQEEHFHNYLSSGSIAHTETGFRDGSSLEEVVEKQADLIEYLKQHNTLLSKRILSLTAQQIRD